MKKNERCSICGTIIDMEVNEEEQGKLTINPDCKWLKKPINTHIPNPRTGKEYILSGYYEDAAGNRHFTHEQAIEIGERTPGWGLCTDEFHRALAEALWDKKKWAWRKDVCGTSHNGYEYLTKVLEYELGGFRDAGSRAGGEGALWDVGNYGCSWSSAVSGIHGMYLYFNSCHLYPSDRDSRGHGFQVRCLQE